MDTLTHALSGALVARASARKALPVPLWKRVAAGFLAAAAPDLDFVIGYIGPAEYLLHHRGVTHSVVLLPLWALLLAWVLAKLLRVPDGWRALYGISALALAVHIAGDVITSFGTVIFAPLSQWRAALGTTFIIDLWFTGIILTGLLLSLIFRSTKLPAVVASAVLAGYVGLQFFAKQEALQFGEQYARAQGLSGVEVSAQPRPVSPFNWTVFVSDEQAHRFAHVNVAREQPLPSKPGDGLFTRLSAPYMPLSHAVWHEQTRFGQPGVEALGRQAWNTPGLAFFRWFAALPAFDGVTEDANCVWFSDLRFLTPGREAMPFRFGACRENPGGAWRPFQRIGETARIPLR